MPNELNANVSARVVMKVASYADSRMILDDGGATKLYGMGDLLYKDSRSVYPVRAQGALVTPNEIRRVRAFYGD